LLSEFPETIEQIFYRASRTGEAGKMLDKSGLSSLSLADNGGDGMAASVASGSGIAGRVGSAAHAIWSLGSSLLGRSDEKRRMQRWSRRTTSTADGLTRSSQIERRDDEMEMDEVQMLQVGLELDNLDPNDVRATALLLAENWSDSSADSFMRRCSQMTQERAKRFKRVSEVCRFAATVASTSAVASGSKRSSGRFCTRQTAKLFKQRTLMNMDRTVLSPRSAELACVALEQRKRSSEQQAPTPAAWGKLRRAVNTTAMMGKLSASFASKARDGHPERAAPDSTGKASEPATVNGSLTSTRPAQGSFLRPSKAGFLDGVESTQPVMV